jgi:GTP-binding protein EngB required for normal cell division
MIHFDFVVSDEEAQTIFDCIDEEIENMDTEIYNIIVLGNMDMDTAITQNKKDKIKWFGKRIKYLRELKEKMKNVEIGREDY